MILPILVLISFLALILYFIYGLYITHKFNKCADDFYVNINQVHELMRSNKRAVIGKQYAVYNSSELIGIATYVKDKIHGEVFCFYQF